MTRLLEGRMQEIILTQEALFEERIGHLADTIVKSGGKSLSRIAGPSSSGKTTFSHRLSIQLAAEGLKPHPFPLDDYYTNRDQCRAMRTGNSIWNVWKRWMWSCLTTT